MENKENCKCGCSKATCDAADAALKLGHFFDEQAEKKVKDYLAAPQEEGGEEKCIHCGQKIATRNPTGYCDHLYYPDNCEICTRISEAKQSSFEEGYGAVIRDETHYDQGFAAGRQSMREEHLKKINTILNKYSKSVVEGGLDYQKAFEEMENYEHELATSLTEEVVADEEKV